MTEGQEVQLPLHHPGAPFLPFSSLHLAFPFILLTISLGAFLDHMFYPLSLAKQPYYINLLAFPVTCSLPVNSRFPMLGLPIARPQLPDHCCLCLSMARWGANVSQDPPGLSPLRVASGACPLLV